MIRVAHVSIPAEDCDRAIAFYREAFAWEFRVGWRYDAPEGEATYWLVESDRCASGVVEVRLGPKEAPKTGISVVFEVDSLDHCVARIRECGGEILAPRLAVPGICWFASCRDTEGNLFAISQPDPQAG